MELASAAVYDGGSAVAEAALLALRVKRKRKRIIIAESLNPFYKQVLKTYLEPQDVQLVEVSHKNGRIDKAELKKRANKDTSAFIFQSPNFYGVIENPEGLRELIGDGLLVTVANPISLALLKPPGDYDVDVVVGEGQSFGWHKYFGGPALGFFASRKKFVRKLPGRIVGETTDTEGQRGFVLVLQTREQHIRRQEATSNVCTNETLIAIACAIYLSLAGENGLRKVANLSMQKAHYLARKLTSIDGVELVYSTPFFNEFLLELPVSSSELKDKLYNRGFLAGYPIDEKRLLLAVTEKRSKEEMDNFVKAFGEVCRKS